MAPTMDSQLLSVKSLGLNAITLLSVVVLFVVLVALRRRYISPVSDIPGPFFATFSIFWKLRHIIKGHIEEETIALHKKHGNFVRITHNEVSVSHPEAVDQLLVGRLRKGDHYQAFALPDRNYGNQMSELDPKEHVRKNKNIASGYALSNILKAESYVDTVIELLEGRLDQMSQIGEKIHLDRWFNFCAFDIVGEITFSKRFGFVEQDRDIGGTIANNRKLQLYISLIGHAYWLHGILLGNPIIGWLNLQPSNHIFDTCLAAVEARKMNEKVRKDMMEQWLEQRRTHPDRMEEKEVLAAAVSNIGAGADTISTTLQTVFYYLLRNPKHLGRLREELDAAHSRGELSPIVSHLEAQKLVFLQACIKEAYRFHSAVSFGLPRVAGKEGVTIAGRTFPEGSLLSVNPWVIHRNTDIFGEDAESFNPARWLDQARVRVMDKYLIHWGTGYNQCPGRNLAHVEISKISATLLRDYDITQVDPKQDWTFKSWFVALPTNKFLAREKYPVNDVLHAKVIGGGVVGLAIARQLAARDGTSTVVVEKHGAVGTETSSRNSEVIHAGLYYGRDSLKTKLCIQGKNMLYDLCAKYHIPHRRTKKWIVAQDLPQWEECVKVHKFATSIGVPTRFVSLQEGKDREPSVKADAGILESETTGIVDSHALMSYLHGSFSDRGGDTALHSPVTRIDALDHGAGGYRIFTANPSSSSGGEDDSFTAETLINSAGLYACAINNMLLPPARHRTPYFAKGSYFSYSASHPKPSTLVYPAPSPGHAGLGTHLTVDLAGRVRFGPDVEFVDDPTDYKPNPARLAEAVLEIRKYLPDVRAEAIDLDYCGIRPKLGRASAVATGKGFLDFVIQKEEGFEGFVNLLGIESPGLTSALAIAEMAEGLLYR